MIDEILFLSLGERAGTAKPLQLHRPGLGRWYWTDARGWLYRKIQAAANSGSLGLRICLRLAAKTDVIVQIQQFEPGSNVLSLRRDLLMHFIKKAS